MKKREVKLSNVCKIVGLSLVICLSTLAVSASAAIIDGQNWADSVSTWSGSVQNYGGTLMDADTTWWLTGPSDSDVDENGYAWDDGVDNDYVAGWRGAGSAYITMYFDTALDDIQGDDLVIHLYGGSGADASVWASSDGSSFTNIGSIGGGTPGYFCDEVFGFNGLVDSVHYVRVDRIASGPGTGMFFDSFASVPEPASMTLLVFGSLGLLSRYRCRKSV